MKKTFLMLAIMIASYSTYAQTNTFPSSGNVGIGTITPTDLLHINAGANRKGITITSDGDADAYTDITLSVNNAASMSLGLPVSWEISHRKDGYFSNTSPGQSSLEFYANLQGGNYYAPLSFKSDGNVILVSNKNALGGNVGIGTTSPNGKLEVSGAILLPGSITNTMSRPAISSTHITGEIAGYSANGLAYDDGFLRLSAGGGTNTFVKSYIDLSGYSTIPDLNGNIILGTAGTERMRLTNSGNIAIGTTDPQGYKLAVNGNAIATSMTVKLYANWPDYVFKKSYKLLSLSDVKTFIDKNQHLPDMPSEQEVLKDGINLGEMVKLQTKKIEELTLYLIQQKEESDKQNKRQQEQINELKNQLAKLIK